MSTANQLWLTLIVLDSDVMTVVVRPTQSAYIGRDPSANDVVLHDAKVSRTHARLATRANGFALQDLGSARGTTVNGKQVAREVLLKSGDLIGIGPYVLRADIRPWRHLEEHDAGIETVAVDRRD